MREIVLDTETTGFNPAEGHRIVEIGCLELENFLPTGKSFHVYLNPEREVPAEATAVHGITNDFLKDKPLFSEVADAFLDFIQDSTLIIHNANFDMRFLNAELAKLSYPKLKFSRTCCTLLMARELFPGSPASLDALCRRFKIDNSNRTYHGALLDSELLADVYLELRGGRQTKLGLHVTKDHQEKHATKKTRLYKEPRVFHPTPEELSAHEAFMSKIKAS